MLSLNAPADFDQLRRQALGGASRTTVGSNLAVEEVFARLAALGHEGSPDPVAFHCIEDGCHARAQIMLEFLHQLGAPPDRLRRVWAFSEQAFDRKAPRLRPRDAFGVPLLNFRGRVVEFDYHVALAVFVQEPDGSETLLVIDPSLLSALASIDEWLARVGAPLHRPNVAQVSELGVAPTHPATRVAFPGGGYWPFPIPHPLSPSSHARREMTRFMRPDAAQQRRARPLPPL